MKFMESKISSTYCARGTAIGLTLLGLVVPGFAQYDNGNYGRAKYVVQVVPDPRLFLTLGVLAVLVWLIFQNSSLRRRLAEAQNEGAAERRP